MHIKKITSGFHSLYWSIDEQIEKLEELHWYLEAEEIDREKFEDKLIAIISNLADIKNLFRGYK